eukprot:scaffold18554_cov148-Isochrysis_galbana.AAC.1
MAEDARAAWIDAAKSGVVSSLNMALPGLVAAGCTPDSATDKHGLTALHHAVLRGHDRASEHLLAVVGARADVFSGSGSSPLVAQVQFPRERVTLNTFTPLHVASLQGNVRSTPGTPARRSTGSVARPPHPPARAAAGRRGDAEARCRRGRPRSPPCVSSHPIDVASSPIEVNARLPPPFATAQPPPAPDPSPPLSPRLPSSASCFATRPAPTSKTEAASLHSTAPPRPAALTRSRVCSWPAAASMPMGQARRRSRWLGALRPRPQGGGRWGRVGAQE